MYEKIKCFFIDLRNHPEIPLQDKKILLGFFISSLVPIFIIPGWMGPFGLLGSLFIFSFIPDYLFNVIDQRHFLSIYPFSMKSYNTLKRAGQFIATLTPTFIAASLWQYKKDVI